MRRPLLVILSLLIASASAAQQDTVRKYLDGNLRLTSKRQGIFAAMAIRQGEHWMLVAVYPDTTIMLKMFFKDKGLAMRDGPYSLYYPKNLLWQKGNFVNNQVTGLWQTWYRNKQLKEEGTILDNRLQGVWKSYYDNGQLKSEQHYAAMDAVQQPVAAPQVVADNLLPGLLDDFLPFSTLQGPAKTWYASGQKESEVNYYHDTLSGVCTWFRENGQLSSRETYVNGKVMDLECFDEDGIKTGSACSILKPPLLIHPFFSALDYIEYELHKQKNKDIIEEGEATVSFMVTKEGRIEQLVIKSSPDSALSKHIISIFAAMPAWSPAIVHNRRIDYPFEMTIPYYRNID